MNPVLNALLRHKPVLAWRVGDVDIAAGTRWARLRLGSLPELRVRQGGCGLREGLERMFNTPSAWSELMSGMAGAYVPLTGGGHYLAFSNGEHLCMLNEQEQLESIADLHDWLELASGKPLVPQGAYRGATCLGGEIRILGGDLPACRVSDRVRLCDCLGEALQSSIYRGGCDGLDIMVRSHLIDLVGPGGVTQTLTRTAAAHLLGVLLGA